MNELRALLALELRSLYGVNTFLHAKDRKKKRLYLLLCAVWALLIGIALFCAGALAYGLCILRLGRIVPAYLTATASLLLLFFGLFAAGPRLFSPHGYDLLASMPIRPGTLVLSRFLALYAQDLLLTLVILVPGASVYAVMERPGLGFFVLAPLGAALIPAIPLVLSCALGTLILAISSRMKHKSLVQTALMAAFVVAVLVLPFLIPGLHDADDHFNPVMLFHLAQSLGALIGRLYPPAAWLGDALVRGNLASFACFALVSLSAAALTLLVVSRYFHAIQRRLHSFSARHDYQLGGMTRSSLLKALYVREVKRYFSSSVYVTNTIIGPIMGMIMSIALCVTGVSPVLDVLPFAIDIPGLLPFVFAAVFGMMPTTSVAISMEGRQMSIIKSLPIPMKPLLQSKILLNLSLMLPFYLVSVTALALAVRPAPLQLLWLLLLPACILLFGAVLGITVNLRFHSFDWDKEESVVKQSLPAMLGGFAPPLLSALLGVAAFVIPAPYGDAARLVMCALLLAGTALLARRNNAVQLENL